MATSLSEIIDDSFMYFAYGSNLNTKRMRMHLKSPERIDCGFIKDYKLDFNGKSDKWQGAMATLVEDNNGIVWGEIWKINLNELDDLERQELVGVMYKSLLKIVETPTGEKIPCRLYLQCPMLTIMNIENNQEGPSIEKRPSKTYLDTIIQGAIESKLPLDYIENLQKIPNNGLLACKALIDALNIS